MSTCFHRRLPAFALAVLIAAAASAAFEPFATGSAGAISATAADDEDRKGRFYNATTAPQPAPPTLGERAAKVALQAVGTPYRWGGESPSSGFDCSGLVRWAYLRVGVSLPHSSYALFSEGRRVSQSRMEPGDVLFFEGLGHVGLYLGRSRMVHAPQSGRRVEVVGLGDSSYGLRLVGARRIEST